MDRSTYEKAIEILNLLNNKVDYAIAQLTWLEIKEGLMNGN